MCKCALKIFEKMQKVGPGPKMYVNGNFPIKRSICKHLGEKIVSKVTKIRVPDCEWSELPRVSLCLNCGTYLK